MRKNRPKLIPTVYMVLIRENKILLSRRYNTGFQDGSYSFPSGHLKNDEETFSQALVREAMEEIGIQIDPADLELVHVMHRRQQEPADERRINLFFKVRKWKGEPSIMEPNRCDDLQWFDSGSLPDNTIPYIRQAINLMKKNAAYSEYGFSTSRGIKKQTKVLNDEGNALP
jgi:8-oxo-dGTP diphosphatase